MIQPTFLLLVFLPLLFIPANIFIISHLNTQKWDDKIQVADVTRFFLGRKLRQIVGVRERTSLDKLVNSVLKEVTCEQKHR